MNLLLLGGTSEARELVALLAADNVDVVTSLAGSVADPHPPEGTTRVGGFGGADGLADYLRGQHVDVVVDATHPFAGRMSANAAAACGRAGVPLLRLSRPSWAARPDAASWHWVDSITEARETAGRLGSRVFLAIGRQALPEFADWVDRSVVARVVDSPAMDVPGKDMEPGIQISLRACGEPALLRVVRTSVDPAVDLFDLLSEVAKQGQRFRLQERNRHGDHGQGQNTAGVLDGLVRVRDYGIDGSSHDVSPEKGESPGH